MCGRYVVARTLPGEMPELLSQLAGWPENFENFNIAPTSDVPIVLESLDPVSGKKHGARKWRTGVLCHVGNSPLRSDRSPSTPALRRLRQMECFVKLFRQVDALFLPADITNGIPVRMEWRNRTSSTTLAASHSLASQRCGVRRNILHGGQSQF